MPKDYLIGNIGYRVGLLNVQRTKRQKGLKYNNKYIKHGS